MLRTANEFFGIEKHLRSPPPPSLLLLRPVSLHTAAIQNSDRSLLASVRDRFFVFGFGSSREGGKGGSARGIRASTPLLGPSRRPIRNPRHLRVGGKETREGKRRRRRSTWNPVVGRPPSTIPPLLDSRRPSFLPCLLFLPHPSSALLLPLPCSASLVSVPLLPRHYSGCYVLGIGVLYAKN